MRKIATLGLLVLLAVLAMPTASATEYYLVQDNSSVANPGDCTNVSVWLNATQGAMSGLFTILYDPNCADIPSFTYNNTCFVDLPTVVTVPGRLTCGYSNMPGGIPSNSLCTPGLVHLGDFEICCNTTTPPCQTDLVFYEGPLTYSTGVWDMYGAIPFTVNNGSFTCGDTSQPDLIVESITPYCDCLFGNESNTIEAVIKNNGTGDITTQFNVSICIGRHYPNCTCDGIYINATIFNLGAGTTTTVNVTDPTIRNAGEVVNITAIADREGVINESNETNNDMTLANQTVMNNGYKGKRYTGGPDILVWKVFDLRGNLVYSVGDSYYLSSYSYPNWTTYNVSWTSNELPVDGEIKEARLYAMYTWDKDGVMPDDVDVSFNGNNQEPEDAHYWDEIGGCGSFAHYPYGMLAYNVTTDFNPGGNYANLTNSHIGGDNVSIRGMFLIAIYGNESEPRRVIIVNEEFDLLYGGASKCTTPEEATAWEVMPVVDPGNIASANLITVAPGAGGSSPEGDLLFNGNMWTDVWDYAGNSQLGIDDRSVNNVNQSGENLLGFRSSGDYMEASNAILIVEMMDEVVVSIDPCPVYVYPGGNVTVNITLSGIADYGSGTIKLCCGPCPNESAYALIESVGLGDSDEVIYDALGGLCVNISAYNTSGASGSVRFASVTLKPMGPPGERVNLSLTVYTLYDRSYNLLQTVVVNCVCGLHIIEDDAPVVVGPVADPPFILNDTRQMRGRLLGTNVTNLTVHITDATSVEEVYVNLTPILGNPTVNNEVMMTGPDEAKAGVWYWETNASYSSLTPYCLTVMAKDYYDNWNNGSCIQLEVQRRGDVKGSAADNKVTGKDYYHIARWTVGLESEPNTFRGNVVPAESWNGMDMADALYIAMYVVGNEDEP